MGRLKPQIFGLESLTKSITATA